MSQDISVNPWNPAPVLRLLGLARKGGYVEAGEEPVGAAARARRARAIFTAQDAAGNSVRRAGRCAETARCGLFQIPVSKSELGAAIGRSPCAMLAVTDAGLAGALVRNLPARGDAK